MVFTPSVLFCQNNLCPNFTKRKAFAHWQKEAHKDVECAFGVLQSHWHLLTQPIELWDSNKIQKMVMTTIILHNMMVCEQLEVADHCWMTVLVDTLQKRMMKLWTMWTMTTMLMRQKNRWVHNGQNRDNLMRMTIKHNFNVIRLNFFLNEQWW